MIHVNYLLPFLKKYVLSMYIKRPLLDGVRNIVLLQKQTRPSEGCLYIGYYELGLSMLSDCPDAPTLTVFCCVPPDKQAPAYEGAHNVIFVRSDLLTTYNLIDRPFRWYQYWKTTLMESIYDGKTIHQVIDQAAEMIKAPVFVLNPAFKVICGSQKLYLDDPYAKELFETGSMSLETTERFFKQEELPVPEYQKGYRKFRNDAVTYHLYEVYFESHVLTTTLFVTGKRMNSVDMHCLISDFSKIISHFAANEKEALLNRDALCSALIEDIVEENTTDPVEIENRLKALPKATKQYYCFVLVQFTERKMIPYGYVMHLLENVFPSANMTIYRENIVILHSQDCQISEQVDFNQDELEWILERFDAYASVSNGSKRTSRLRTLYLIAEDVLRIGKALKKQSKYERIFDLETYSMYHIIDSCAQHYIEQHHHCDIIYLIHPAIIKLSRYDAQHKTNLRDVLFYYLLCGRNLKKTAEMCYMHRNTVINKINKINELVTVPIDDGYLQNRLILSCITVRYYENYLGGKIEIR